MTAPVLQFATRSGELVGEGCCKDVAYLRRRIRAWCGRGLGLSQPQKAALGRLLAAYGPDSPWWRSRNGYLVSALCRDAWLEAVCTAEPVDKVPEV